MNEQDEHEPGQADPQAPIHRTAIEIGGLCDWQRQQLREYCQMVDVALGSMVGNQDTMVGWHPRECGEF